MSSQREAFHTGKEHFTYKFHQAPTYAGTHEVTAHDTKDKQVGTLTWNANQIENVSTVAKHRRKGIATAMLVTARRASNDQKAPVPAHSTLLTQDGKHFRDATGGRGSAVPDEYLTMLN